MGCTSSKLYLEKLKSPASVEDSYYKIQAVLKVESYQKPKKRRRSSSRNSHSKKNENDNHRSSKDSVRPKKSKVFNVSRSDYDPKILAKYNVKALIGKGTFSRVLRVENKVSKQPFALKLIDAPGGRETFEAELSVLMRVSHPNVIKLNEVFESNNKIYMVMELATGGNLLDRLEAKGMLSEEDARNVIQMVLNGVKCLHALGITHRDLKPDNLLYYHPGQNSKIMISDFGLASTRMRTGSPFMNTICGTPQYIAPEIVSRKAYTCSVDIWAVGVITYIVLCGTFPFNAEHDAQIFKLILKGKVNMKDSVWATVSSECKLFILDLLQHNSTKRPTAEAALKHPWITSSSLTYSSQNSGKGSPEQKDHSQRSARSVGSSKSGKSISSLRSGHRRVQVRQLEALSSDPEVAALM